MKEESHTSLFSLTASIVLE